MRLQQIKVEFIAAQDRLLLRMATDEGSEVLLWLTRRCVKRLWPVLIDMAQSTPDIALQPNPEARNALLGFRHEAAVNLADFSTRYDDVPRARPLGTEPIVITRIQPRRDERGNHVLGLFPPAGPGVHMTLDEGLLHGLVKLLQSGVAKTDWDLALRMPSGIAPPVNEAGGRPTIN